MGDDMTRLNDIDSCKSIVYKIGSTTQKYIEDRCKSYREYEIVQEWETSGKAALYLEEHLREWLILIGYEQWQNKKDYFIIPRVKEDAFVKHLRRIGDKCAKHLERMEVDIDCL